MYEQYDVTSGSVFLCVVSSFFMQHFFALHRLQPCLAALCVPRPLDYDMAANVRTTSTQVSTPPLSPNLLL